jgi:hypothetical protein
MASAADDDVATAVLARFAADGALPGLMPGGLTRGREVATVTSTKCYGNLEVGEGDRPAEYSTGGTYIDYRAVTITLRGLEADVRAALAQVQAVFDMPNGLTIPNATHLVTWPLGRHVESDPATKSGTDIWMGVAKYRVMSQRSWPGN